MKILIKIAAFFVIFVVVVAWKFPYDTLVEKSVRRAEERTGATVLYRPVKAGPLGVRVSDLHITTRSGASLKFDSARIFPTRHGLSGTAYQGENEMKVSLNLTHLTLELTDISVQTGSTMMGQARVTGNLDFELGPQEGGGVLRLVVPDLWLPLPLPEQSLELGATYKVRGRTSAEQSWSGVSAEIKMLGTDFNGDGRVSLQPQPSGPPVVSGSINFEAPPRGKGVLRLSGTWDNVVTDIISR